MPHKYLSVDAVATFLRHRGPTTLPESPPDLARGVPILCVHGVGGNGGDFDAVLDALAEDQSPLAIDLPAHGRTAGLDSLASVYDMADFVHGAASKLGLDQPVLAGHSLGGHVAIEYALRQPGALRALVLIGAGARAVVSPEELERWRRVSEGKEQRRLRVERFAPKSPRELFQRAFMEFIKTDPRALYGDLVASQGWTAEERLGELTLPVLCVVGEHEAPEARAAIDTLLSGAPNARRVEVAGAGGEIPLEKPDELAQAIRSFLSEVGS